MSKVGNKLANDYWEYQLPKGFRKPNINSSVEEIRKFINDKYILKKFIPNGFKDPVTEFLEEKNNEKYK